MTLLEALWRASGDLELVRSAILRGEIRLTGNFKGRELEVCEGSEPERQETRQARSPGPVVR